MAIYWDILIENYSGKSKLNECEWIICKSEKSERLSDGTKVSITLNLKKSKARIRKQLRK